MWSSQFGPLVFMDPQKVTLRNKSNGNKINKNNRERLREKATETFRIENVPNRNFRCIFLFLAQWKIFGNLFIKINLIFEEFYSSWIVNVPIFLLTLWNSNEVLEIIFKINLISKDSSMLMQYIYIYGEKWYSMD